MNVKIFTLRYNSALGSMDDEEVRVFLADKDVISIHDHAFIHGGAPHLLLVVTYHFHGGESAVPTEKNYANQRDETWRKLLTPQTIPLFDALREWRMEKSKAESIPPYFICTNKQLAVIVRDRPQTLADLGKIEGIGKNKLEKYGKEILKLLGSKVGMKSSSGENSMPSQDPVSTKEEKDEQNQA